MRSSVQGARGLGLVCIHCRLGCLFILARHSRAFLGAGYLDCGHALPRQGVAQQQEHGRADISAQARLIII